MLNINQDELQAILLQLEQALYNHNQWYELLTRTLVCRLPYDRHDVGKDAHRECRFGQWYYNYAPEKLHDHPGFIAIGTEHERMHTLAASLIHASSSGTPISLLDYNNFANTLEGMRLQIHTLKRELEDLMYNRDPLTGANSRIGMLTKLRELQELVRRGVESCCIAMMDLDNFKSINDTYGHVAGDRVLAASAYYMIEHLRVYDKVYRYGGEEFLISMQNASSKPGFDVVERLREGIAANPIDFDGKDVICVTASFGLTLLDPDVTVEQSVGRADKALYAAKVAGRNCTRIWDPSM